MISIRMLKICGESILKPLELIFESCIKRGKFSIEWKKTSVLPVHKKNDKQLKEDCHPISLLPICDKISERLIYNKMFEFFTDNELISSNQSGLKPGDSCINKLLCITHDSYQSFLTYQKYLIKFGMSVYSINWSKMIYQVISLILS